jgi:hypothetical protein
MIRTIRVMPNLRSKTNQHAQSINYSTHLSCVWIETGNPAQPLACVWIDKDLRAVSSNSEEQPEIYPLCA